MSKRLPPIESVLSLAREAGALARSMQPQATLSIKQDGTAITEADIACHNMLMRGLQKLSPGVPIISEEQPEAENKKILFSSEIFYAIDPLDVTANYAARGNAYSINIALIEHGIPVMGVINFPGLEELYYSDGSKAYKQAGREEPRAIHVAPLTKGATAAVRPHERATHMPVSENTLKVIFTRGQRRACLVATGEATFCSEREGFRLWDSAATYAIVHAAGGAIQTEDGGRLRYNATLELPAYFVGHPELLRHLRTVTESQAKEAEKTPKKKRSGGA